jgi:hypothetical protein
MISIEEALILAGLQNGGAPVDPTQQPVTPTATVTATPEPVVSEAELRDMVTRAKTQLGYRSA